ncbi:MAG: hypothetical protein ABI274_05160 [Ktedonobacterales bacterium]
MNYPSRHGSVNPRALVGKVILINGVVFLGLALLFGVYWLFSGHGNIVAFVLGPFALIFVGVGVLEVLTGLILRLLPGGESPAARVVNAYYSALANQGYATAFSYLDLAMG